MIIRSGILGFQTKISDSMLVGSLPVLILPNLQAVLAGVRRLRIRTQISGRVSDYLGRRPVLLIGLFGNFLMIFLFGWSTSLWFAILSRSLNGFLNGNVGVAKTYLAEITDDTNAAKG
jgi:MFS family permease